MRLDLNDVPMLQGALRLASMGCRVLFTPGKSKGAARRGEPRGGHRSWSDLRAALRPQTAGGLLAAGPGDRAAACVAALREGGDLNAAVVGEVLSAHDSSAFPAAIEINL